MRTILSIVVGDGATLTINAFQSQLVYRLTVDGATNDIMRADAELLMAAAQHPGARRIGAPDKPVWQLDRTSLDSSRLASSSTRNETP